MFLANLIKRLWKNGSTLVVLNRTDILTAFSHFGIDVPMPSCQTLPMHYQDLRTRTHKIWGSLTRVMLLSHQSETIIR